LHSYAQRYAHQRWQRALGSVGSSMVTLMHSLRGSTLARLRQLSRAEFECRDSGSGSCSGLHERWDGCDGGLEGELERYGYERHQHQHQQHDLIAYNFHDYATQPGEHVVVCIVFLSTRARVCACVYVCVCVCVCVCE
jgi:hypothetical protein